MIQVYGDAGHGNYDYRSWLVLKVQADGYDQAESNAVALYGTLEDQLYVVGLAPTVNGVAAQAGITGLTYTDHGVSPVTWNAKVFSLTLTDTTDSHTGTQILQWIRDAKVFNRHDLVQTNGAKFKTVRGAIYGDVGAALKGVRVVRSDGTTAHPDFDLMTADDGTTWAAPVVQTITVSGFTTTSRLQIYDASVAAPVGSRQLYNNVPGATSYTWVDPLPAAATRDIRVRIADCVTVTAKNFIEASIGTCAVSGAGKDLSYLATQSDDYSYNLTGKDGSSVTGISIVTAGGDLMKFLTGGPATFPMQDVYAYQVYWQSTATGIAQETAFIYSPDPSTFIVSDFQFENEVANTIVTVNNGFVIDAATRTPDPLVSTTVGKGTVNIIGPHAVNTIITVGGSDVITGDIATVLAAIPSTAQVADKVLGRNLAGGSDGGRTVQDALRANRNRSAISGTTLTVYQEDDAAPAWTAQVGTGTRDPLTSIDPA